MLVIVVVITIIIIIIIIIVIIIIIITTFGPRDEDAGPPLGGCESVANVDGDLY